MPEKGILTERLLLVPMTSDFICSILAGEPNELKIGDLRLKASGKWPSPDILEILPMFRDQLKNVTEPTGFQAWVFAKKDDMTIIGDGGFTAEPDENGQIEIGYGLVADEREKGYGFEAVSALISWAFSRNGVKKIRATCGQDNIGSIRILQKVGMIETGRNGAVIYWEVANTLET